MTWLRQLVEAEGEQDPAEFLESLKVDLFEDEVFVFTPKGEVKNLSGGSTPLDFAYAVHTDVGHAASAPRSTAGSCRCTTSCAPATSSKC
jgi:Guanosine polyphosphate pyrophosphohydrolases/synthetases